MNKIKKAVFPVAGLGTRFLPATKSTPKEMLPIVDKPLIQYAVNEAVAAGITELIFITSATKRSIEDYFDANFELETKLQQQGKDELLAIAKGVLPGGVSCVYVRQPEALGLGHAVLCAKDIVGDEPFAVILADDLIDAGDNPCLKQLIDQYEKTSSSVIAVQKVADSQVSRYGIVDPITSLDYAEKIKGMIEKPAVEEAPSNLGIVGRYILTPQIFKLLEKVKPNKGAEIQLTDAIAELLKKEDVYALKFWGRRYDCGSKLGYLEATISYALKHPEIGGRFRVLLQGISL
jgi:UTP--glucose-1-phosphate uridylyltransferase